MATTDTPTDRLTHMLFEAINDGCDSADRRAAIDQTWTEAMQYACDRLAEQDNPDFDDAQRFAETAVVVEDVRHGAFVRWFVSGSDDPTPPVGIHLPTVWQAFNAGRYGG